MQFWYHEGMSVRDWLTHGVDREWTLTRSLYVHYREWCESNGAAIQDLNTFARDLRKHGVDVRVRTKGGKSMVRGLIPRRDASGVDAQYRASSCDCPVKWRLVGASGRHFCPIHDGKPPENSQVVWKTGV